MLVELNLPQNDFKIKKEAGRLYIFDQLRNKYVALTPEEWVRQNFVSYLIIHKGYPRGLMGNEVPLIQNGIKRRCDTLIADNSGKPIAIVEYITPSIEICQNTFNQIVRYNSVFRVKYLLVSNGINHYCCRLDYENNSYSFLDDIPEYINL